MRPNPDTKTTRLTIPPPLLVGPASVLYPPPGSNFSFFFFAIGFLAPRFRRRSDCIIPPGHVGPVCFFSRRKVPLLPLGIAHARGGHTALASPPMAQAFFSPGAPCRNIQHRDDWSCAPHVSSGSPRMAGPGRSQGWDTATMPRVSLANLLPLLVASSSVGSLSSFCWVFTGVGTTSRAPATASGKTVWMGTRGYYRSRCFSAFANPLPAQDACSRSRHDKLFCALYCMTAHPAAWSSPGFASGWLLSADK